MSQRRQIRLRKEYLYKKHQEAKELVREDKKRRINAAVESGNPIPTELIPEARLLHHELEMDVDPNSSVSERNLLDDEYARIGLYEPKVCVTTSRDPSSRLKQFAKEVKLCIPNAQNVNRGGYRTDDFVAACRKADFTDIVVVTETRGMPDGLTICHLPFGPTAYFTLTNCVLRHDIPECTPASQAYPHLIIDGMNSAIGKRFARILQALYPIPKEDTRRVITFANNSDYISFRHHVYNKEDGKVTLKEAGPRFEMLPYELRLGTMEQKEAEKEWVLRPFLNTARKKQAL